METFWKKCAFESNVEFAACDAGRRNILHPNCTECNAIIWLTLVDFDCMHCTDCRKKWVASFIPFCVVYFSTKILLDILRDWRDTVVFINYNEALSRICCQFSKIALVTHSLLSRPTSAKRASSTWCTKPLRRRTETWKRSSSVRDLTAPPGTSLPPKITWQVGMPRDSITSFGNCVPSNVCWIPKTITSFWAPYLREYSPTILGGYPRLCRRKQGPKKTDDFRRKEDI